MTLRLKNAGIFLLLAAGALLAALLPFLIRGNPLVWTELGADGLTQHATFLEYMFENGLLFSGGNVYEYTFGLGADALTSMAYYMMYDPVNLLLYILPRGDFLANYSFLTAVKLLITGISMYVYLGDKVRRFPVRAAVSVAYMLSGFALYVFLRHPDLAAGAMYLPLVILGLERVLDGKRPFMLVLSAFFTLISNFYMFYMTSVFVVLYAVIYYLCRKERRFLPFVKAMLRTAGWYLLGIALAGFVLLPAACGYVTAARSASKGFRPYGIDVFIAVLATFFIPATGPAETPVMLTPVAVALVLSALPLRRARPSVVAALVLTAAVVIPLGGYFFNLFNYVNNRFVYLLTFSALSAAAFALDEQTFAPARIRAAVQGTAAFAGFILVVAFWYFGFSGYVGRALSVTVTVLAVPVTLAYLYMLYVFVRKKPRFARLTGRITGKRAFAAFSALALVWAVTFTSYYSAQFGGARDMYQALTLPPPQREHIDAQSGFTRVDWPNATDWYANYNNRPVNGRVPGTFHYNTVTPDSEYSFVTANGLYNTQGSLGMSGLNGRVALQALLSVGYYVPDGYVPYGFSPVEGVSDLYGTDKYLPFGTVFSRAMPAGQFDALPAVEKQHAALRYVAIDGAEAVPYEPAVQMTEIGDIAVRGSYTLTGRGAGGETYVGFTVRVPDRDGEIVIESDNYTYTQRFFARGGQFYTGQTDFLYNFGETSGEIVIRGDAELLGVYTAFYPYEAFDGALTGRPHLENATFGPDGFSGEVAGDGGYMLIPLSYSAGFTAYVDGREMPVHCADGGLMAVEIPSGTHTVTFSYRTPYFAAGAAVSFCALAVLAAAGIYAWRTDRRRLFPSGLQRPVAAE